MNPKAHDPENRDRDLNRARRLRTGVVSAGVIGSLGVAGVVGYAAVTAAQSGQSAAGASGSSSGSTFSFPTGGDDQSHNQVGGDDGGEHEGDDGQPGSQTGGFGVGQPAPQLQPGSGSPQGSTSGS